MRIIESNETNVLDQEAAQANENDAPAKKHVAVENSIFGTVEAHDYENGVCKQCGWIDTSGNSSSIILKNSCQYVSGMAASDEKSCIVDPTFSSGTVWKNHYYNSTTFDEGEEENWYKDGISNSEKEIVLGANDPYPDGAVATNVFGSSGILDLTKIFSEEDVEAGYTLVGIGTCTFYRTYMDAVIIPWTVRYIDTYAFANCGNLRTVIFEEAPEGMEDQAELYINSQAFASAGVNTSGLCYLTQIMFPKHLKAIATSNAAFGATALKNIVINSDVKEIKPDTMEFEKDEKGNEVIPNIFRDKSYPSVSETHVFAALEKDEMSELKPNVQSWNSYIFATYEFYYFGDLSGEGVEWAERYYDTTAKQWADIVD